jgi:aspartate aminotransferase
LALQSPNIGCEIYTVISFYNVTINHIVQERLLVREISLNAQRLEGQPMFKLLDKVRRLEATGQRLIHFEIGDPDFATPPNIVEAGRTALANGETHYVSSWGIPDFVEAIRETTTISRGFTPKTSQVLVVPGANIAIFYALFCLVNQGQEVLVPDPGFPTYASAIKMCGAKMIPYPLRDKNEFRLRAADIEPLITPATRLLIINSPQNPTGAVTEKWALRDIYDLCVKHDMYLYSDEIYARMNYDNVGFTSPALWDACRDRVILSNGFSKAFAMTGWRLGAVIGPEDVMERMMLLLQTTSSCVPPFVQRAGIEALRSDQIEVHAMMAEYRMRRDLLVSGLNAIPGVRCHLPGGAFYAFPNIRSFGLTSTQFADYLLEKAGVALLPGNCFGGQGEGFIRICYANSRQNIAEGLDRIGHACAELTRTAESAHDACC